MGTLDGKTHRHPRHRRRGAGGADRAAKAVRDAGAEVDLISLEEGEFQGFNHLDKGDTFTADKAVADADADDYDGLVLPGGVANPDFLRVDPDAVAFVRAFFDGQEADRRRSATAPWMLVEADVVKGRTVTSWPSLQTDLRNAGATWVDEEVVVDQGLVTSRKPDDLPAFCAKIVEEFAEGRHEDAPQPAGRRATSYADAAGAIPRAPGGHRRAHGGYWPHGAFDLDRRDLLRTGHRPGQALQRGQPQDRALPPAQRQVRRAHRPEARRPVDRRRGRLRRDRQGLRARARPLRGHRAGELERSSPKKTKTIEIEDFVELSEIDPIFYDHPYYLAPGPAARSPTGCCRGHARDGPRRDRAGGDPLQGGARRPAPDGRPRPGHVDDALRRRGRRPRQHRRDRGHGRRRGHQARARHRQAARRVARRARSSPTSTTTPTARRSSTSSSARRPARRSPCSRRPRRRRSRCPT